jgi:thiol-disulfide isomerase/thioredoxin
VTRPCLASLAVLLLAAAASGSSAAEPAPTLVDPVSGRAVAIDPQAGVVHLVFFATWCPPCIAEFERLAESEARWKDRGYKLVLIAVQTRHTRERLASFVGERRPPGTVLFDETGEAQKRWGAEGLPAHVLLDRSGQPIIRGGALNAAVESAIEQSLRASRQRGG